MSDLPHLSPTSRPSSAAGQEPGVEWNAWLEEHREPLRQLITRRLAGEGDEAVDDILQEVAVAAHRSEQPPGGIREGGAWLRRVAIRKVQDYWRRIGRRRRLHSGLSDAGESLIEAAPSPCEWVMALESRSQLDAALKRLSRADRELLEQKYLHNRSYEAMAASLGITVKSLEYRLGCARQALRQFLIQES